MLTTIQLLPGISLHCYRDARFKQGTLSFQFLAPMTRAHASQNALLPAVLLRGSQRHPDLRAITQHLDDLYGASIGAIVRRAGDYQASGFGLTFIDDRFVLAGETVLASMVDFLRELLLCPARQEGAFRRDYVESEKKNLIAAIESRRNDKAAYAADQLMKKMCPGDSLGISRLGEPEQVHAITAQSLYAHYRALLSEAPVEIFYVGSAQSGEIAALLAPLAAGLGGRTAVLPPQRPFQDQGGGVWQEEMDISQTRLNLAFVSPITMNDPLTVPMRLFNVVFGGGMVSKLFMILREKMSLCYDISSSYQAAKGILTVTAGIDAANISLAREEILRQLDACCRGEITPAEFTSAQAALRSSLRSTFDTLGSIEGYYFSAILGGMELRVEEYRQAVENAAPEQVAQAARTLKLHSEFVLKGVNP